MIMSLDNEPMGAHFVTGVAPAAELVPLRVARPKPVCLLPGLHGPACRKYKATGRENPRSAISTRWQHALCLP